MYRSLITAAALLCCGALAQAGELDREYGGKSKAPTTTKTILAGPRVAPNLMATLLTDSPRVGSELDAEAPTQACWGRGWGGGWGSMGWGGGWGGMGWGGMGWGGGWGGSMGWGGWGGGWGWGRPWGWGGWYSPGFGYCW